MKYFCSFIHLYHYAYKLGRTIVGRFKVKCFGTSIWDETLYKAWSSILHSLIPNAGVLAAQLSDFSDICGADEVVLFEKETFLVISHTSRL